MTLARTQDDIVARMSDTDKIDMFGFALNDLAVYLDYERAKPFLKDGVTQDERPGPTELDPVDQIRDYMSFAWDKALGERGLSSDRSIIHMATWLWLAGEDELVADIEEDRIPYEPYGRPILRRICKHYNLDIPSEENNR